MGCCLPLYLGCSCFTYLTDRRVPILGRRGYPIKTKDVLDDRIRAKISVVVRPPMICRL